jgi:hypothetical protein
VTADAGDRVSADCETVSRQLAVDPFSSGPAQHATEVEPDTFAFGSTVVATYQVGRIFGGASMAIGWSTSTNAGRTWRSGRLPGVTAFTTPPGIAAAASDPAVAYDAAHGTWLVASLAVGPAFTQLLVSRSADGIHWDTPVVAAANRGSQLAYDKEWISCDNGTSSPFRGRCYRSYTDLVHARLATQWSGDGGVTWSAPVAAAPELAEHVVGVVPASLPDGTLVLVFLGEGRDAGVWSVRSLTGGATFEPKVAIATLRVSQTRPLRVSPLPSVEADGVGHVWAAWYDCRFRTACNANDLVVASTTDGATWTPLTRVPAGPPTRDYLLPGLAAAPNGLAIVYYSQARGCVAARCTLSAHFIRRRGGRWTAPRRLTPQPVQMSWIAATSEGRMVGDYLSASWTGGHPVAVWVGAQRPRAGRLREAVFAYRG